MTTRFLGKSANGSAILLTSTLQSRRQKLKSPRTMMVSASIATYPLVPSSAIEPVAGSRDKRGKTPHAARIPVTWRTNGFSPLL